MAINPGFVFTDAVPAQQALGMAQVAALEDQARRQMMSDTLRSATAQNVAKSNAAEQRALTQSQMLQQDKALAQREIESKRNADLLGRDLDQRRLFDTRKDTTNRAAGRFEAINTAINSTNPPTALELESTLSQFRDILTPEDADILRANRGNQFMKLKAASDYGNKVATMLNTSLKALKPTDIAQRQGILDSAQKQYGKVVLFDPATQGFSSLYPAPREDNTGMLSGAPENIGAIQAANAPAPAQSGLGTVGDFAKNVLFNPQTPPGAVPIPNALGWNPVFRYGLGYNPALLGIKAIMDRIGGQTSVNAPPASVSQPTNTPFYPPQY